MTIVEGVIFAVIVMTFRRGIIGELQPIIERYLSRQIKLRDKATT